jgi:hypothetical protein
MQNSNKSIMSANKLPSTPHENAVDQIIPFLWIRRGIGILGILFPFIMALGNYLIFDCPHLLPAISDYFHTKMMTLFVALLSMISIFLWTYRGPKGEDRHWATLAAVFCLGVALFPNDVKDVVKECNGFETYSLSTLHQICAIGMFIVLAYFCLFIFVKTNPKEVKTPEQIALKKKRNTIYKICGYSILVAMVSMFILIKLDTDKAIQAQFSYIFWGESLCLIAFGTSWITKGDWFIFGDGKTNPMSKSLTTNN